jgi:hypothetical protein
MADEKKPDWGSWAANDEQKLTLGLRATPRSGSLGLKR